MTAGEGAGRPEDPAAGRLDRLDDTGRPAAPAASEGTPGVSASPGAVAGGDKGDAGSDGVGDGGSPLPLGPEVDHRAADEARRRLTDLRASGRLEPTGTADLDAVVRAARDAQTQWVALGPVGRAARLRRMAERVRSAGPFLAGLEAVARGVPVRGTLDVGAPCSAAGFDRAADAAELGEAAEGTVMTWRDLASAAGAGNGVCGTVGLVVAGGDAFKAWASALAPALAAGDAVVVAAMAPACATAMELVRLGEEAGLPAGLVGIITTDESRAARLLDHPGIEACAVFGGRPAQVFGGEASGRTPAWRLHTYRRGGAQCVVFEDADIDSAVEAVADLVRVDRTPHGCSVRRALVAEAIEAAFMDKLRARLGRLRVGDPFDRHTDIGPLESEDQRARVRAVLASARAAGVEVWQAPAQSRLPDVGLFEAPAILRGLPLTIASSVGAAGGPLLEVCTFRTPAEALSQAQAGPAGGDDGVASIWSTDIGVAIGAALGVRSCAVWVNRWPSVGQAAGARIGGGSRANSGPALQELRGGGAARLAVPATSWSDPAPPPLPPRLGARALADGGGSAGRSLAPMPDRLRWEDDGGALPSASLGEEEPLTDPGQRDERLLASASRARAAAADWATAGSAGRSAALRRLADELAAQAGELAALLSPSANATATAESRACSETEVEHAAGAVRRWAARVERHAGSTCAAEPGGLELVLREPRGPVGVLCQRSAPVAGIAGIAVPLAALGNPVVVALPGARPLAAAALAAAVADSGLPSGVLEIVAGDRSQLAWSLVGSPDLAMVLLAGDDLAGAEWMSDATSAGSDPSRERPARVRFLSSLIDWWNPPAGAQADLLRSAVRSRYVWLPHGA